MLWDDVKAWFVWAIVMLISITIGIGIVVIVVLFEIPILSQSLWGSILLLLIEVICVVSVILYHRYRTYMRWCGCIK